MNVDVVTVTPEPTATGALIKFTLEVSLVDGEEAVVSASGYLCAPYNVIVSPLTEAPTDQDIVTRLTASDGSARQEGARRTYFLWLVAELGRPELEHLVELRSRDPKGDLQLTLRLSVRGLVASATVTRPDKGRADSESLTLVAQRHDGFLNVRTRLAHAQCRIASNDWLHDFAPKLGLGKFVTFELPQPSIIATGVLEERMTRALAEARRGEQLFREGRWPEACAAFRPVWELVRKNVDLSALLIKRGYTPELANSFMGAADALFQLCSKFVHATDKAGNLTAAAAVANKEEAQLVFVSAMAFVNIVARKLPT